MGFIGVEEDPLDHTLDLLERRLRMTLAELVDPDRIMAFSAGYFIRHRVRN